VPRYKWVNVRGLNLNGQALRFRARGILARVIQHEIDHLNGVLFFDRMDDWSSLGYPAPEEAEEEEAVIP
jgi:peptide deformylase